MDKQTVAVGDEVSVYDWVVKRWTRGTVVSVKRLPGNDYVTATVWAPERGWIAAMPIVPAWLRPIRVLAAA